MSDVSAAQIRAARGLLGWSQEQLAEAAKVGRATIADFEIGKRVPYPRTLDDIRGALEIAGVEFIAENGSGPGVRLKKKPKTHEQLTSKIAELHEALPHVDEKAKPSPHKAMKQLEHAHVKNEIAKVKGTQAKIAKKGDKPK